MFTCYIVMHHWEIGIKNKNYTISGKKLVKLQD
jgi:hypothetical protein